MDNMAEYERPFAIVMVTLLVLALLYLVFAPAHAADASTPTQPAQPQCTWPATVPITLTIDQMRALLAWSITPQPDVPLPVWASLRPTLEPQVAELQKKYCK